MITGRVTSAHESVIPVEVEGCAGRHQNGIAEERNLLIMKIRMDSGGAIGN
jgi:hypothetical protein